MALSLDPVSFLKELATQLGAQGIFTLAVFVVMVYFLYKGIKFGVHLLMAAIAGGAFPFLATLFLGLEIPLTFKNIILYATGAAWLYLGATVGKKIFRVFGRRAPASKPSKPAKPLK